MLAMIFSTDADPISDYSSIFSSFFICLSSYMIFQFDKLQKDRVAKATERESISKSAEFFTNKGRFRKDI
jgi:hypothetical protein